MIGGYNQFEYDDSDRLLNKGYSICFYKDEIKPSASLTTGTCTLNVGKVFGDDSNALRKTLLIRGDVIYTYKVTGEASISLRDCNI